jgi:hypothetical protein
MFFTEDEDIISFSDDSPVGAVRGFEKPKKHKSIYTKPVPKAPPKPQSEEDKGNEETIADGEGAGKGDAVGTEEKSTVARKDDAKKDAKKPGTRVARSPREAKKFSTDSVELVYLQRFRCPCKLCKDFAPCFDLKKE